MAKQHFVFNPFQIGQDSPSQAAKLPERDRNFGRLRGKRINDYKFRIETAIFEVFTSVYMEDSLHFHALRYIKHGSRPCRRSDIHRFLELSQDGGKNPHGTTKHSKSKQMATRTWTKPTTDVFMDMLGLLPIVLLARKSEGKVFTVMCLLVV